jgi:hypothetical protein
MRAAAMDSHSSLADALFVSGAPISGGTPAMMASSACWSSWYGRLANLMASHSWRAYIFTFISELHSL